MRVKITSKRQVTFPKKVLEEMGLKPGDSIDLERTPQGYQLRPHRAWLDWTPPLKGMIPDDYPDFDLEEVRRAATYTKYRD